MATLHEVLIEGALKAQLDASKLAADRRFALRLLYELAWLSNSTGAWANCIKLLSHHGVNVSGWVDFRTGRAALLRALQPQIASLEARP